MNALQRSQFSKQLDKEFSPSDQVIVDGNSCTVQCRYTGQRFNRVQVCNNFTHKRMDVHWLDVFMPGQILVVLDLK